MKRITWFAAAAVLFGTAAPAAHAQQGFAVKGHYVFNRSKVDDARASGFDTVPSPDGFDIGAEYVLPMGIGVGVSAYTEGKATRDNARTSAYGVLAEANYFVKIPVLPIRPYVGVHAGLGRYTIDDVNSSTRPQIRDSRTQLGYQLGVRFQPTRMFGIDAQYRRVSDSASDEQSPDLERNQVLVGVTLF